MTVFGANWPSAVRKNLKDLRVPAVTGAKGEMTGDDRHKVCVPGGGRGQACDLGGKGHEET